MNPFQRLGAKISNWWKGEPQDSGGKTTLNSPSFLERIGKKRETDIKGHIFHMSQDAVGNPCKNAYQILSENGQGNH